MSDKNRTFIVDSNDVDIKDVTEKEIKDFLESLDKQILSDLIDKTQILLDDCKNADSISSYDEECWNSTNAELTRAKKGLNNVFSNYNTYMKHYDSLDAAYYLLLGTCTFKPEEVPDISDPDMNG